jgi:predicted nucleic acid-binding protein
MKYVLDASVAFKWEVPEADSPKAIRLREEFRQGVHELLSPDFLPLGLAHALTRAERQGKIAVGHASLLWADAMAAPPALLPVISLTPRAINLSSALRIGVYDCLYVVLAERETCQLITADDKLIKKLQPHFPFIIALASLP